nr:hypothetical protein [Brevibacillus laterosporus]
MRTRIGWMGFGLGVVFSALFLLTFGQKAISMDEIKKIATTQGWVVLSKEEFQNMQVQVSPKETPQAPLDTSKVTQSGQPASSSSTEQKQPEKSPATVSTTNNENKKSASEKANKASESSSSTTDKQKKNDLSSQDKKKTEQSAEKSIPPKDSSSKTQQQTTPTQNPVPKSQDTSVTSPSSTDVKESVKKQEKPIEQSTNNKQEVEEKGTPDITPPVPPTPPEPPKAPVSDSISDHK